MFYSVGTKHMFISKIVLLMGIGYALRN